MIELPIYQNLSADNVQEIELGGQLVQIRLIYNIRNGCWMLRFKDQNGNEVKGIKVVPNWPLFDNHRGLLEFVGDLMVIKTDEKVESEITYDNFGNGWGLFYFTAAELNQWRDDNGF